MVASIAADGMGDVFRAPDKGLNHNVAVKAMQRVEGNLPACLGYGRVRISSGTRNPRLLSASRHPLSVSGKVGRMANG
jgi:hypothetical protein